MTQIKSQETRAFSIILMEALYNEVKEVCFIWALHILGGCTEANLR